jgi:hypothetical protein
VEVRASCRTRHEAGRRKQHALPRNQLKVRITRSRSPSQRPQGGGYSVLEQFPAAGLVVPVASPMGYQAVPSSSTERLAYRAAPSATTSTVFSSRRFDIAPAAMTTAASERTRDQGTRLDEASNFVST